MEYNPLLSKVQENPYPYYTYLRQHAPVYWVESLECWALSRYADVGTPQFVLRSFSRPLDLLRRSSAI